MPGKFKMVFGASLVGLAVLCGGLNRAYAQDEAVYDPLEPLNRGIFWFNDKFDIYIFEPVARGYDHVVPDSVQDKVGNFFSNLRFPIYLLSDVVQFKFGQAGTHTARFLINSTLGVGGLFEVADGWGLKEEEEDFGIALAYHDIPPGPYLVLPFLGPSNFRDGIGRAIDSLIYPTSYLAYSNVDERTQWQIIIGARVLEGVDTRAGLLEAVESAKESSLDYYLFMQSAYYQYRRGVLYDNNTPESNMFEEDVSAKGTNQAEPDEPN